MYNTLNLNILFCFNLTRYTYFLEAVTYVYYFSLFVTHYYVRERYRVVCTHWNFQAWKELKWASHSLNANVRYFETAFKLKKRLKERGVTKNYKLLRAAIYLREESWDSDYLPLIRLQTKTGLLGILLDY